MSAAINVKASHIKLIFDAGVEHGLSGRPLKRYVKRKLDKIIKKALKKTRN